MSQTEFESNRFEATFGAGPLTAIGGNDEFWLEVLAMVREFVEKHNKLKAENTALAARIEALELRTVDVEKQAAEFRYRGVWQPGEQYRKNNFITYDASVWVCLRDTEGKPGQCLDWQLAVRKGKDGKDARAA